MCMYIYHIVIAPMYRCLKPFPAQLQDSNTVLKVYFALRVIVADLNLL